LVKVEVGAVQVVVVEGVVVLVATKTVEVLVGVVALIVAVALKVFVFKVVDGRVTVLVVLFKVTVVKSVTSDV